MSLRKLISIYLVCLLAFSPALPACAGGLQNKLNDIRQQANNKKAEIAKEKSKEGNISVQLKELSEKSATALAEYHKINDQLDETKQKIHANELLLAKTQEKLQEREKILDKRVRDIYMHRQISYIDVLVGANDFSDFLTRIDLIKRIIKYDCDLIQAILQEKQIIANTQKSLNEEKEKIQKLANAAQEKYALIEKQREEQKALFAKVQSNREAAEKAYAELVAASEQVEQMIIAYNSGSSSTTTITGSGQMIWPISGPITSPFGWRMHPIYGRRIFHSGIDIGGDYGRPIVAAAAGTVIYAGWISGYGYAVIISHGGGLETLYGHNEALAVHRGQTVRQGQVISYCGSTGNSTGPHCHFEVRRNGRPVNPLGYL